MGVLWGLVVGVVASIFEGDWWPLLAFVVVGAVLSGWQANAMSRALRAQGHSPYESS